MKTKVYLKQLVRYPYCRIYRSFLDQLIRDRSIRKHGGGLLFHFIALFTLANYRPSYRALCGVRYPLEAGEWIAPIGDLCERLCLARRSQLLTVLRRLQEMQLLTFTLYPRQRLVKFRISCWQQTNTSLDYSAPCQKDMGFIFFPVSMASELVGAGRCSETDMLLDLWLNAVFNDTGVIGSEVCPVVYFRNGSKLPMLNYAELAKRWGVSKSTVHRFLKKFEQKKMLVTFSFPGTVGSVVVLTSYLSTMFCVADPHPSREQMAAVLSIELPEPVAAEPGTTVTGVLACVEQDERSVPNPNLRRILECVRKALFAGGFYCCSCPHAIYRLSNLSDCVEGTSLYDLSISCGETGPRYFFSMTLQQEALLPALADVEVEVI